VTLTGAEVSNPNSRDFVIEGKVSWGTRWMIERSMFLEDTIPGQGWFPFAAGDPGFNPAEFQSLYQFDPLLGPVQVMSGPVQSFPLLPPPPPLSGVGARPRVNYVSILASFIWYDDGSSMASWISGGYANNNTTVASTKFTATELDLSDPEGLRQPMGLNLLHSAPSDPAPRLMTSCSIWPDDGPSPPAPPPLTAEIDQAVRQFLITRANEIRADLFPPVSAEPPAPPTPVSLDRRSFFRLRADGSPVVDLNGNGISDAIEAAFAGRLIISEACFLSPAAHAGELVGGESADWVEIWNPNDYPVRTDGYFLSDNSSISASSIAQGQELALPLMELPPGGTLRVHCTAQGRARLLLNDPHGLLPWTTPFDLSEQGADIHCHPIGC
jgi:hypothetical protein